MLMGVSPDITAELGEDLSLLVRAVNMPLVAVTPVSVRGYPTPRSTAFRLQFADGRVFKASRLESAQQALTVESISRCLEHAALPETVARSGRALLTQWVEGQSLAAADWPHELLRQCGALQGRVHTHPVDGAGAATPHDRLAGWLSRLDRNLATLVDAQALQSGEARSALQAAGQSVPRRYQVGFILGDFCPENIVRRPSGELCVIDNETLAIGPSDYDLGRTWYRWPMTRAQRAAYLEGYADHRSPADALAHFPFWAITAIVDGAVFRHRLRPQTTPVAVHRLRVLLRELEHALSPDAAMYLS
jgi:phosphotransferase family enzyme